MSELIARILPAKVSIDFGDPISREFVERDPYTGSYTVTPTDEAQTLATNGLRMTDDVTVEAIPPLTETKQISVTQNGTVTEDVAAYANAEIAVNVPTPVMDSLSVTENGSYAPASGHAYNSVNVAVPVPSGTKNISISENGTTTHDVESYKNASITVAVPQPTGTKQISLTQNGTTTHDVSAYASAEIAVTVPVPTLTSATFTDNGTYTPATGTAYNSVTVSIPTAVGVSF